MENVFFGMHINPATLLGKGMALLLATLLSTLIGLNRQRAGSAAGMRTHILVCVGATLITMTSLEVGRIANGGAGGDPGRLMAQIVSGIGFLGAGAILRDGLTIHGLTTAASVWTTAGIGIAVGVNPRLGELAVVATGIVLFTLFVLEQAEFRFKLKLPLSRIEIVLEDRDDCLERILNRLTTGGVILKDLASETNGQHRTLRLRVQFARGKDKDEMTRTLLSEPGVTRISVE